jgi:hypothetical protein
MIQIHMMETAGSSGEEARLNSDLQEVRRSLQSVLVLAVAVGSELESSPGCSLSQPHELYGMIPAWDQTLSFYFDQSDVENKRNGVKAVWKTSRCRSMILKATRWLVWRAIEWLLSATQFPAPSAAITKQPIRNRTKTKHDKKAKNVCKRIQVLCT